VVTFATQSAFAQTEREIGCRDAIVKGVSLYSDAVLKVAQK
jgi:hypothetical protein